MIPQNNRLVPTRHPAAGWLAALAERSLFLGLFMT
jgi:hypothetical protein